MPSTYAIIRSTLNIRRRNKTSPFFPRNSGVGALDFKTPSVLVHIFPLKFLDMISVLLEGTMYPSTTVHCKDGSFSWYSLSLFFRFSILWIEASTLCMFGGHSLLEPHPSLSFATCHVNNQHATYVRWKVVTEQAQRRCSVSSF